MQGLANGHMRAEEQPQVQEQEQEELDLDSWMQELGLKDAAPQTLPQPQSEAPGVTRPACTSLPSASLCLLADSLLHGCVTPAAPTPAPFGSSGPVHVQ